MISNHPYEYQPFGTFFICGLGEEDFTDIPEQAIPKYSRMFSRNEFLIRTESGIGVFTS